jgi:hypothetical protein
MHSWPGGQKRAFYGVSRHIWKENFDEKDTFCLPRQHTNLNFPTLDITGSLSSAVMNLQLFYNI